MYIFKTLMAGLSDRVPASQCEALTSNLSTIKKQTYKQKRNKALKK